MVHEAEALEKPGRPTFFETPAWNFSLGLKFLLVGWIVERAAMQKSSPP